MRFAVVLLLLSLVTSVRAESVRPERAIRLCDAIDLAIRNNPTLGAAIADVAIADGQVKAARGLDDFLLEGQTRWNATRQRLVSDVPLQEPSIDAVSASVALTKPLPTGGRLGLTFLNQYSRTNYATPSASPGQFDRQFSQIYAPSLTLTLEHPLLRGSGVRVARADKRRAALRRDTAGLLRDAAVARLLRDVVTAYAHVAASIEELEIRKASVNAAREQLERVKADIGVGKQPPSGSAEVEVAIARREDAVFLAEQALVERSLELERLTGEPIDQRSATFLAADALTAPASPPPLAASLAAALARNPELRALESQGRSAAIEIEVTESGLLPQLDIALSGGPAGYAPDPPTAYSALVRAQGYSLGAGLVFQEPIGRHAARGADEAARAALHKIKLDATELRQQIATAVVRGIVAVDAAGRRAAVLARSIESATLDLAAERARFESSRSSNFDVLRRQDQLTLTKLGALAARLDYMRSLAAVESVTGDILSRHGVQVQ